MHVWKCERYHEVEEWDEHLASTRENRCKTSYTCTRCNNTRNTTRNGAKMMSGWSTDANARAKSCCARCRARWSDCNNERSSATAAQGATAQSTILSIHAADSLEIP
jgi:hypothetical protein